MDIKFNYKVLFFRVLTTVYTAFLFAFCKSYLASPDLVVAVSEGLKAGIPAVFAAFGLDQIVFHYVKNNQPS